MTAPSGERFNYSDAKSASSFVPVLFWFAHRLDQPELVRAQMQFPNRTERYAPLAALWWPRPNAAEKERPLAWRGRGANPVAVFRSSWTDPNALYLAIKGGSASLNHAHMDAGSFVLEADGIRWACDLGLQDYNSLESKKVDLWNRKQDSDRWRVFRLNNFSHNTLTIDGKLHRVDGHAPIIRFSDAANSAHAVLDLTTIFQGQVKKAHRGFRLLPGRSILVQDDLSGLTPGAEVRWAMTTNAEVECSGRTATLRQNGKVLRITLLEPEDAICSVIPADRLMNNLDAPNSGVSLLATTVKAPESGTLRIAFLLSPGRNEPVKNEFPSLTAPETWSEPVPGENAKEP